MPEHFQITVIDRSYPDGSMTFSNNDLRVESPSCKGKNFVFTMTYLDDESLENLKRSVGSIKVRLGTLKVRLPHDQSVKPSTGASGGSD